MIAWLVVGLVLLAVVGGGLVGVVVAIAIAVRRRPPAARPSPVPAPRPPPAPVSSAGDADACTELWTLRPPRRTARPGPARSPRVIGTHRQAGWPVDGQPEGR